jgi:phosphoserine phosphatase RsbU/P
VTYDERAYVLSPGDVLVLYSDGITERNNAADELYGTERLRELVAENHELSATELVTRIFDSAEEFAGGVPANDDGTLVVLKVKKTAESTV